MKRIGMNLFPGGGRRALTMSYDDGRTQDRRLVGIFNDHGIKGSFHLNSGLLGREGYLEAGEVRDLFAGHEVSAHSLTHPVLNAVPVVGIVHEILEDRRNLEGLAGYPVRGMSYPFGAYDKDLVALLPSLGIEYSRTVNQHNGFGLPGDYLQWHPTCHHNGGILERAKSFLQAGRWGEPVLMYVWGHSYEFDNDGNWGMMEEFCAFIGGRDDVWYATNIEILDYTRAQRSLRFSADGDTVFNPSCLTVWVSVDGAPLPISPGATVSL